MEEGWSIGKQQGPRAVITVGCCGFPVKREEYYSKFEAVELQTTFYNLPKPSVAIRWSSEAPKGFLHVLKAWQAITHPPDSPTYRRTKVEIPESEKDRYGYFRRTDEVSKAWEMTRESARILHSDIILFQSPPSFEESPGNLFNIRAFFEGIERGGLTLVWEARGEWAEDTVKSLCSDLNVIRCVDPFSDGPVRGKTVYYRLHGKGGYGYRYSDADLERLLDFCRGTDTVYVFFNNISMFEDALRFRFTAKERA